ncbi:MAG TPA: prepilin peptidase [Candidatus Saccharimonadales bacterium]|nr:prepilin peptidase [Candidatus Saccharimonadales bacterium]
MDLLPIFLGLVGLAMGSFVDALVWRLKNKKDFVADRSECESCHHKLGVKDLVPVISWLSLGGKCRYCGKKISTVSPVIELSMGALFVLSYFFWPLGFDQWQAVASFVIWLIYLVLLTALFVYDLRWMLLPDKLVFPLITLGLVDAGLRVSLMPGTNYIFYVLSGVTAIAGFYGLLYFFSKGKWVGFGDVKLSIFIGAVLGWQKAIMVLLFSNVIGFLYVVPGLALGKLNRKSRIPFGPFLIIAFFIAGLFGDIILNWYIYELLLVGV